jgi:hypothetical protein
MSHGPAEHRERIRSLRVDIELEECRQLGSHLGAGGDARLGSRDTVRLERLPGLHQAAPDASLHPTGNGPVRTRQQLRRVLVHVPLSSAQYPVSIRTRAAETTSSKRYMSAKVLRVSDPLAMRGIPDRNDRC